MEMLDDSMIGQRDLLGMDEFARRATCGEVRGYAVCEDCGSSYVISSHCMRFDCPDCWKIPARRLSMRSWTYTESLLTRSSHCNSRSQHWVFSPPPHIISPEMALSDVYDMGRRMIRRFFPNCAGELIFHPYRLVDGAYDLDRHADRTISVDLRYVSDSELLEPDVYLSSFRCGERCSGGAWMAVRSSDNWRDYVVFSPHFHFLAVGYFSVPHQHDMRALGWVIKRVRPLVTMESYVGCLMYLLSHCLFPGKKKRVSRWINRKGYCIRVISKEDIWEYARCSRCGGIMRRVPVYSGDGDVRLRDCEVIMNKRDVLIYREELL